MDIRKILTMAFIAFILPCNAINAKSYDIPDIASSGVRGLTVQREILVGSYFMRMARGNLNIIDDPVLTEYLTSVGNRLVMNAQNVNFPFEFFIVNNKTLNASAFLGGKLQVSLYRY